MMNELENNPPDNETSCRRTLLRSRAARWILGLLVLWGASWMTAAVALPIAINRILPKVAALAKSQGIELTGFQYESIRVSPLLNGIRVNQLQTSFDLRPDDARNMNSQVEAACLSATLSNPFTLRGTLNIQGLEVRFDESDLPEKIPFDRFTNGEISLPNLSLLQPQVAVREVLEGLEKLFSENQTEINFAFAGDVKVVVNDTTQIARMYTERNGQRSRLRFERADIESIANKMKLVLAPEQIDIVSLYPLRVPAIILITQQARELSQLHEPADIWRKDAHRHVTWSFLLTKMFGADFAQLVTDANEMKDGNTDDERAMDFHNNAIGRRLASAGVTEKELANRIKIDSDIIRHPAEVKKRSPSQLLN